MWIIKWSNLDFGGIDTLVVQKDTLAYGFIWKKIISTRPSFWSTGLLREDTLIGKVWYQSLDPFSDSTYLVFDFTLQIADTFNLLGCCDPSLAEAIVDSAYHTDTGKIIRFNSFIEDMENITFIEGIGGNQGPIYKWCPGMLYPYLSCAYKDGIQTYANVSYDGNCNPPLGINQIDHANEIEVYPNPVEDVLYIKNLSEILIEKVEVFDALGRKMYSEDYPTFINFSDLMPGLYYIRLITSKGQNIIKAVMKH